MRNSKEQEAGNSPISTQELLRTGMIILEDYIVLSVDKIELASHYLLNETIQWYKYQCQKHWHELNT